MLTEKNIDRFRTIVYLFNSRGMDEKHFDLVNIVSGYSAFLDHYKVRYWDGEEWFELVDEDTFDAAMDSFKEVFEKFYRE